MAKLSAHGSEIARLCRNFPRPKDPDFASEDVYLSLRSDGFVLERRALNWPSAPGRSTGKIKAANGAERRERIPAIFPKLIRNLTGKGYTLKVGPAFFKVRDHLKVAGHDSALPDEVRHRSRTDRGRGDRELAIAPVPNLCQVYTAGIVSRLTASGEPL